MKTAAFVTMTALAALMVATPGVVTQQAEAKIKVATAKANNIKPRIKVVRPRVRLKLNTKQLAGKTQNGPTSQNTKTRTTKKTVKPTATNFTLLQQRSAADRLAFENQNPGFATAIRELERIIGGNDLGGIDVSSLVELDVASLDLPFSVDGLGDDDSEASPFPPGFVSPVPDPSNPGGIGGFDPTDVLPDKPSNSVTDTADAFRVTQGSIDDAANGIASDKIDTRPDGTQTVRAEDTDGTNDAQSGYGDWRVENGTAVRRGTKVHYDGTVALVEERRGPGGSSRHVREHNAGNPIKPTYSESYVNDQNGRPIAGGRTPAGVNPSETPNPDAPGKTVTPPNCGSYDCNRARKGYKLNPGVVASGGIRVNPGPNDGSQGIVAQAPRTNEKYRKKAVTNPGTEPQDEGNGNGPFGDHTPILVIE